MNMKKFSVLGVVLGVIAGALIAVVRAWMFWLAPGVALGLYCGANRKRNFRPDFGQGAGI